MKTLIVEDDLTNRLLLQGLLSDFGPCQAATNGREAVRAVGLALASGQRYDLICLDIMMPEMDGQQALSEIRALEQQHGYEVGKGTRILMTTIKKDKHNVIQAFRQQCDGYLVKPIDGATLQKSLRELGLIPGSSQDVDLESD